MPNQDGFQRECWNVHASLTSAKGRYRLLNVDGDFDRWAQAQPPGLYNDHDVDDIINILSAFGHRLQRVDPNQGIPGQPPRQLQEQAPQRARTVAGARAGAAAPAPGPAPAQLRTTRMQDWPNRISGPGKEPMQVYTSMPQSEQARAFFSGLQDSLSVGQGPSFATLPAALSHLRRDKDPTSVSFTLLNYVESLRDRSALDGIRQLFVWKAFANVFEALRRQHNDRRTTRNISETQFRDFFGWMNLKFNNTLEAQAWKKRVMSAVRRGFKLRYLVKHLGIGCLFLFGRVLTEKELDDHFPVKNDHTAAFREAMAKLKEPRLRRRYEKYADLAKRLDEWLLDAWMEGANVPEEDQVDSDEEEEDRPERNQAVEDESNKDEDEDTDMDDA